MVRNRESVLGPVYKAERDCSRNNCRQGELRAKLLQVIIADCHKDPVTSLVGAVEAVKFVSSVINSEGEKL